MVQNYLSDIELYFAEGNREDISNIYINGDEAKHIARVMRHNIGDIIYVTNGVGFIYESKIINI